MGQKFSLEEMAIEVRLAASREARSAEVIEVMYVQSRAEEFARVLEDIRRTAEILGAAYGVLKALAESREPPRG